jgi:hypothetical protein
MILYDTVVDYQINEHDIWMSKASKGKIMSLQSSFYMYHLKCNAYLYSNILSLICFVRMNLSEQYHIGGEA